MSDLSLATAARDALLDRFRDRISHNGALDRTLVSFQGNRQASFYNWFKYREGFSQQLVHYLLKTLMPEPGVLLDPFAGAGSALFAARELGWVTSGIELLPVGIYAIQARLAAETVDAETLSRRVRQLLSEDFLKHYDPQYDLNHIAITRGAYPEKEEKELIGYVSYCNRLIDNPDIRSLLLYAAFCVLEDISYTRKDGQYLRWDVRSGRAQGKKPFHKGIIRRFRPAIEAKLDQIVNDLIGQPKQISFLEDTSPSPIAQKPQLLAGSCLDALPTIPSACIDFVLTSPPYANRYDYTRTYALELVYLGCSDEQVKQLRQTMLSCTVENKNKRSYLEQYYSTLGRTDDFVRVDDTFNRQNALQEVLAILASHRDEGKLNNPHIVRLVHNYFYEMSFVIYELARVLQPGGVVAMVNDNVRYSGEEVPVDLILSDIAESFGLVTRHIWTLGRGKGNSSQQMGNHGRTELRKCVYVWQKGTE